MMKKVLVAVYDKVAKKINDPFCSENFETAKRTIKHSLSNSPALCAMAGDLELRELGVIDFVDGFVDVHLDMFEQPVCLADLIDHSDVSETK